MHPSFYRYIADADHNETRCAMAWSISAVSTGCGRNVFERLVEDAHILLREFAGRKSQPTAVGINSQTLQSTPADYSSEFE